MRRNGQATGELAEACASEEPASSSSPRTKSSMAPGKTAGPTSDRPDEADQPVRHQQARGRAGCRAGIRGGRRPARYRQDRLAVRPRCPGLPHQDPRRGSPRRRERRAAAGCRRRVGHSDIHRGPGRRIVGLARSGRFAGTHHLVNGLFATRAAVGPRRDRSRRHRTWRSGKCRRLRGPGRRRRRDGECWSRRRFPPGRCGPGRTRWRTTPRPCCAPGRERLTQQDQHSPCAVRAARRLLRGLTTVRGSAAPSRDLARLPPSNR